MRPMSGWMVTWTSNTWIWKDANPHEIEECTILNWGRYLSCIYSEITNFFDLYLMIWTPATCCFNSGFATCQNVYPILDIWHERVEGIVRSCGDDINWRCDPVRVFRVESSQMYVNKQQTKDVLKTNITCVTSKFISYELHTETP